MPDAAAPAVRHVILGTAGHIDHGKTTLVQQLTGTWADRLPEERERGMTIDLGYAAFSLPDGTEVGLLDVPGHESFVHTMVAGATTMDLALLVVAADDGPMLQTREHLEILDLLGVSHLVVALTKIDLVDADMVDLAEEMVSELLAGTAMAGAEVVRVSSVDGTGIDALKATLQAALPPIRVREDDGRVFRMPVLRSFLVPGRGAVLTGIPISGRIEMGAKVEVLPPAWQARVRGIQVHGADAAEARRGHRTALALSDVGVTSLKRGMVVVEAGTVAPVQRIVAQVRLLAGVRKPLDHGDRVRLHVGAARVIAQVHLPAAKPVQAGQTAIVELMAVAPVVAFPGDRFVLREENAASTLGGGVIIDLPHRRLPRRRAGLLDRLTERVGHLDNRRALLLGVVESLGEAGTTVDALAARTGIRLEEVARLCASLQAKGQIQAIGRSGQWIDVSAFGRVLERVEAAVTTLHDKDPGLAWLSLATVRAKLARVDASVVDAALAKLVEAGTLERNPDGGVRHQAHSDELPAKDRALCERIEAALLRGAGRPPDEEGLAVEAGCNAHELRRAMRLLASHGRVHRGGDHWFASAWVDEAKDKLRAFAEREGGYTPGDARTLLDTTRKWIIPLLESLDKAGFSRRAGDRRVLR